MKSKKERKWKKAREREREREGERERGWHKDLIHEFPCREVI